MGRKLKKLLIATLLLMVIGTSASAFGTVSGAGQDREHEKITRAALECGLAPSTVKCFQPKSIGELAGAAGTFGAVGAPDQPFRGLITDPVAHCDDGDTFQQFDPLYPAPMLHNSLQLCKARMAINMDRAMLSAGRLLRNGAIDDSQIPTFFSCTFNGSGGRAKCEVLEYLGLTLHASQDFYSHTNWNDAALMGAPLSTVSPPGLGNHGPAPWLNLRLAPGAATPAGLISGCFKLMPESLFCNDGPMGQPRVKHDVINKDKGVIILTPGAGATVQGGSTSRGLIGGNFQRAVEAAITDTQDKWLDLQERIMARYGLVNGTLMICAITHDDPANSCVATNQSNYQLALRPTRIVHAMMFMAALFMLNEVFGRGFIRRRFRRG